MTEDIGDAVVIDEEIAERINPSQAEATNEGRKLAGEDHPEEPPRRRRTSARDPFPNEYVENVVYLLFSPSIVMRKTIIFPVLSQAAQQFTQTGLFEVIICDRIILDINTRLAMF